ncbi:hypothetical protein TI39_contig354g00062 [Zymoseptoria brevis]|uniref:Uncharacterized protein n=1 Tax=Zymoseptoria brevis TaxID=1047168 RepID=A0A0F4GQ22_9PEZI|nr:hypothetical protein TI39_contig354g00062 [Zymoseptoria brevis]
MANLTASTTPCTTDMAAVPTNPARVNSTSTFSITLTNIIQVFKATRSITATLLRLTGTWLLLSIGLDLALAVSRIFVNCAIVIEIFTFDLLAVTWYHSHVFLVGFFFILATTEFLLSVHIKGHVHAQRPLYWKLARTPAPGLDAVVLFTYLTAVNCVWQFEYGDIMRCNAAAVLCLVELELAVFIAVSIYTSICGPIQLSSPAQANESGSDQTTCPLDLASAAMEASTPGAFPRPATSEYSLPSPAASHDEDTKPRGRTMLRRSDSKIESSPSPYERKGKEKSPSGGVEKE